MLRAKHRANEHGTRQAVRKVIHSHGPPGFALGLRVGAQGDLGLESFGTLPGIVQ
jgi:hypothetical protein